MGGWGSKRARAGATYYDVTVSSQTLWPGPRFIPLPRKRKRKRKKRKKGEEKENNEREKSPAGGDPGPSTSAGFYKPGHKEARSRQPVWMESRRRSKSEGGRCETGKVEFATIEAVRAEKNGKKGWEFFFSPALRGAGFRFTTAPNATVAGAIKKRKTKINIKPRFWGGDPPKTKSPLVGEAGSCPRSKGGDFFIFQCRKVSEVSERKNLESKTPTTEDFRNVSPNGFSRNEKIVNKPKIAFGRRAGKDGQQWDQESGEGREEGKKTGKKRKIKNRFGSGQGETGAHRATKGHRARHVQISKSSKPGVRTLHHGGGDGFRRRRSQSGIARRKTHPPPTF